MEERLLLRELYGSAYLTILPDGQKIPWKPLSIGDYLNYEDQLASGVYPAAYLENEIFRKCVLNPVLTKQIDKLLAGTVSTVVFGIIQNSAPQTLGHIEYALNVGRMKANTVLHDMVNVICQAYPAYKPEDVYAMDFETFITRVGTAERKLLNAGLLQEPLSFTGPEDKQQKPKRPPTPVSRLAQSPPVNMAKEFKKQQQDVAQPTVITARDSAEQQFAYTGHEKTDKILLEHQMMKDTAGIYKDYMDQMRRGEKIQIKTPEERKAAALIRAEENKKIVEQAVAKKKQADTAELKKLAAARKVKRTTKRR